LLGLWTAFGEDARYQLGMESDWLSSPGGGFIRSGLRKIAGQVGVSCGTVNLTPFKNSRFTPTKKKKKGNVCADSSIGAENLLCASRKKKNHLSIREK